MHHLKLQKKWKAQKQYVAYPYKCPKCDSGNISASETEFIDGGEAIQNVDCLDCGAKWRDIYKLKQYEKRE